VTCDFVTLRRFTKPKIVELEVYNIIYYKSYFIVFLCVWLFGGGDVLIVTMSRSHCPQRIRETQTLHLRGLNITFAKSKRSVNIFLQCRALRIWFLARNVVPLQCI
jgi:hypothetical protein